MGHEKINLFYGFDDIFKRVFHAEGLKAARHDIERGVSELWEFDERGFLIVRGEYDKHGNKTDFVLVALVGCDAREIERYAAAYAMANGFKRMRVHSIRTGAERYLKPLGYHVAEVRGREKVFVRELKWD